MTDFIVSFIIDKSNCDKEDASFNNAAIDNGLIKMI